MNGNAHEILNRPELQTKAFTVDRSKIQTRLTSFDADFSKVDYGEGELDLIIATLSLFYAFNFSSSSEWMGLLSRVLRTLKPGGKLFLDTDTLKLLRHQDVNEAFEPEELEKFKQELLKQLADDGITADASIHGEILEMTYRRSEARASDGGPSDHYFRGGYLFSILKLGARFFSDLVREGWVEAARRLLDSVKMLRSHPGGAPISDTEITRRRNDHNSHHEITAFQTRILKDVEDLMKESGDQLEELKVFGHAAGGPNVIRRHAEFRMLLTAIKTAIMSYRDNFQEGLTSSRHPYHAALQRIDWILNDDRLSPFVRGGVEEMMISIAERLEHLLEGGPLDERKGLEALEKAYQEFLDRLSDALSTLMSRVPHSDPRGKQRIRDREKEILHVFLDLKRKIVFPFEYSDRFAPTGSYYLPDRYPRLFESEHSHAKVYFADLTEAFGLYDVWLQVNYINRVIRFLASSIRRSEVRMKPHETQKKASEEIEIYGEDVDREDYQQVMRSTTEHFLTAQEEMFLFRALHARNLGTIERKELYDFLVVKYLPFVRRIIRELGRAARSDQDNLIQDGSLGLMEAVRRFDYRRGVRFHAYARWCIRRFIQEGPDEKATGILKWRTQRSIPKILRTQEELIRRLEREPTLEEWAKELGMKEKALIRRLSLSSRPQ
ncbi:MAG TPA: sigma factor, partial [Candidatus Nanoarchaeia archaeon]|nr:sigma factor [Candidatus Nanoarchaeia archaeon]